jgi:hypothetical protein
MVQQTTMTLNGATGLGAVREHKHEGVRAA